MDKACEIYKILKYKDTNFQNAQDSNLNQCSSHGLSNYSVLSVHDRPTLPPAHCACLLPNLTNPSPHVLHRVVGAIVPHLRATEARLYVFHHRMGPPAVHCKRQLKPHPYSANIEIYSPHFYKAKTLSPLSRWAI